MAAYDAVIVGGGPAGALAAHTLAAGGARVLILEKAHLPRYKPCGGGITARARAASPLVAAYPPLGAASTLLLPTGKREVACPLPAPVTMVLRDQFDAYLVQSAVEQGADLRDGVALSGLEIENGRVRLRAGTERITAQYVIGADGANGVTARLAGFPPMTPPAVAIEVELAVPAAIQDRYAQAMLLDLRCIPGGYGWIFGKGEHLSAGLGVFHGAGRHDLRAALARFLATQPDLRAGRVLLQRGHRIPLSGGRRTRRRGPVLLAGDAASLADPLTAEGISYALASGRQAGAWVLAALAGDTAGLAGYDHYLAHTLCGDLRYARLVAVLSYRYPAALMHLAERSPGLLEANTAAVSGTDDYRSLVWLMARKAPKLLRAMHLHRQHGSRPSMQKQTPGM